MGRRHQNPRHRDYPNKLEGIQVVYILQRRALHFHQHIHRHTLRMLGQVRELNQQPYPVVFVFAHTHNAAAAHLHAGLAHVIQGIQPILVGSGGDDVVVVLLGGVQVVVVVIQSGVSQLPGLLLFQHAQGHAGFHAQGFHLLYHIQHIRHVFPGRATPGGTHAEPGRALLFGCAGFCDHFFDFQQLFLFQPGVVMTALGAVLAVLRAGAGFDRQKGADLHFVGVEMLPVNRLGTEQQIVERQVEKIPGFLKRPVVTEGSSGHGKVLLTFARFLVYG